MAFRAESGRHGRGEDLAILVPRPEARTHYRPLPIEPSWITASVNTHLVPALVDLDTTRTWISEGRADSVARFQVDLPSAETVGRMEICETIVFPPEEVTALRVLRKERRGKPWSVAWARVYGLQESDGGSQEGAASALDDAIQD